MEKKIAFENPWYGMINSPEQEARRKARMKQDARVYRKRKALRAIKIQCGVLAALLAVVGIWYQLGA
ncbi:MAG: hypothetical protein IKK50_05470 [Ruminiclostridium sp.]|nr:hypothetical protein [Ruminiclostridium sp.]